MRFARVNTDSDWFKSLRSSSNDACVEVRFSPDEVLVRDSKYQGAPAVQPVISISVAAWPAFLALAAHGSATQPRDVPTIENHASGTTLRAADGTTLSYTPAEWDAFTAGIADGEFDLDTARTAA